MVYKKLNMKFSELFSSGFKKRNQDHFASIIRIAMGDGIITDEEKEFMDRLAQKLEISSAVYAEIIKNYNAHPINPPASLDQRLERLFDLTRIVYADHIKNEDEMRLLTKISIGLGYTTDTESVVNKALKVVADPSVSVEEFKERMQL